MVKILVRVLLYNLVYGFSYPLGRFRLGHRHRGTATGEALAKPLFRVRPGSIKRRWKIEDLGLYRDHLRLYP